MNSAKCPKCSLVQWADSKVCKRCGSSLEADTIPQQFDATPMSNEYAYQSPDPRTVAGTQYAQPYGQPQLKSGLALASMIMAIISFPTTFLLIGVLLAPIALIMGIVSLMRATKKPMIYGGKGFAIAGISVASVVCLFFVPLIAAIAIPNLLASRRAANEGSALAGMQKIASAQSSFAATEGAGECGDLRSLATKGFIDAKYAGGLTNGYKFAAGGTVSSSEGCEINATPASPSEGTRSFYFSSGDNVIRVARRGMPAGPNDPPMGEESRASR